MLNSFFTPYIGSHYEEGFLGSKTLVVGAHHYCPFECIHKKECMTDSRPFDRSCPEFIKNIEKFGEEYKDYYTLSNDNTVEIDCYIAGAPYPAYSAFTKYMLGIPDYLTKEQKQELWNNVAFYQYTQHFLPDGYTPSYKEEKDLFDNDYDSFKEVLEELNPEIVLVWNPAVRDCILAHEKASNTLIYKGRADLQVLSLFIFVSAEYDRVKKKTGLFTAKHIKIISDECCPEFQKERSKQAWYAEQVKSIVGNDISLRKATRFSNRSSIRRLSDVLFLAHLEGLLIPAAVGFTFPPKKDGCKYYKKSWAYFKKKLHELFLSNCNSKLPTGKQYAVLFNDKDINKNAPPKAEKEVDKKIDAFFKAFSK